MRLRNRLSAQRGTGIFRSKRDRSRFRPLGEALESRLLLAVQVLHSNPGAPASLYLDFDGNFEPTWGSHRDVTTLPFDRHNGPEDFGPEQDWIHAIWEAVSEDFAPFNIDVTTEEPAVLAPGVPVAASAGVAMRVAIGSSTDGAGQSIGSQGFYDTFSSDAVNVVYVDFYDGYPGQGDGGHVRLGNTASHEAGHGFGLVHQSLYDANGNKIEEYNPGTDIWAPIMGGGSHTTYFKKHTWHDGPSTYGATQFQDDMAIIAGPINGFGYRPDDHGDTPAAASSLYDNGSVWSGAGIIETNSDVDFFQFTVNSAGAYRIMADGTWHATNLDVVLSLYDASGTLLATADPQDTYSAELVRQLTPGDYFVEVAKTDDYGRVGQYNVRVDANLSWSMLLSQNRGQFDLKTGPDGSLYVLGDFDTTLDFDPGPGMALLTPLGGKDGYLAKYTPDQELLWVRQFGGDGVDGLKRIAFDSQGDVLVTGASDSSSMVLGDITLSNLEGVTAKLDQDGNVVWARPRGNAGVSADGVGNVYVAGLFSGTTDFDPGPGVSNLTSQGGNDGYLLKLDANGDFVAVMSVGGPENVSARRVAAGDDGSVYLVGNFAGQIEFGDFVGSAPAFLTSGGGNDTYLMKLGADGQRQWLRHLTGPGDVVEGSIRLDDTGAIYLTGRFEQTVDFGSGTPFVAGEEDSYVTKWDADGGLIWVSTNHWGQGLDSRPGRGRRRQHLRHRILQRGR